MIICLIISAAINAYLFESTRDKFSKSCYFISMMFLLSTILYHIVVLHTKIL